jgi:hypothetical protein
MMGSHCYTLHQSYTGHGCAMCGEFYDDPRHDGLDWVVEGVRVPQETESETVELQSNGIETRS